MPNKPLFSQDSSKLQRIVLLRHGETVGCSSVRFFGATDVMLSGLGADQAAAVAEVIGSQNFDLVVASPLQRAWRSALIVAPGREIRLEDRFREIDFGRWEGLTREEIEARDPKLYSQWEQQGPKFDFPDGDRREAFRARVVAGLAHLLVMPVASILIVAHKGIVRTIVEELSGAALERDQPPLAGLLELTRTAEQTWKLAKLTL
ncbi:MAG: histidine phosphatase family protein [Myxococcales bacterium]|nr:histidine phosphatase family protein [Myxococcales bacterium]